MGGNSAPDAKTPGAASGGEAAPGTASEGEAAPGTASRGEAAAAGEAGIGGSDTPGAVEQKADEKDAVEKSDDEDGELSCSCCE